VPVPLALLPALPALLLAPPPLLLPALLGAACLKVERSVISVEGMRLEPGTIKSEVTKRPRLQYSWRRAQQDVQR
jgi:hypothetical protein